MHFTQAKEKLQSIQQEHLLSFWDSLEEKQQAFLLEQIANLDLNIFQKQREILKTKQEERHASLDPFLEYEKSDSLPYQAKGRKLIAQGKVGCIVVAGGQGTRLRFDGPKGKFPVTPITHKTLFQLMAEKVIAASKQAATPLPLAIMTSPLNDLETKQFFMKNQLFGLQEEQLFFFCQKMLPFLDPSNNLFLETPWRIAEGPDGNGGTLEYFFSSGIGDKWAKRGIEYLFFIQIDNALADPYDANLVGFHVEKQAEVSIKCVSRKHEKEKVGILVKEKGRVVIREYSELSLQEQEARLPNGTLKHLCANISHFCFSMDFAKKVASGDIMILHPAFKAVSALTSVPNAWKFERFIFDLLPLAKKVGALLYPREHCFAPLKNAEGEDSLATVQAALLERDRQVYQSLSGLQPPDKPFELSQEFHYPTQELLSKKKYYYKLNNYLIFN